MRVFPTGPSPGDILSAFRPVTSVVRRPRESRSASDPGLVGPGHLFDEWFPGCKQFEIKARVRPGYTKRSTMRGCWACLATITLTRGLRDKSYNATEHSNFLFRSPPRIFDRRSFARGRIKKPNVECRSNAIEHNFCSEYFILCKKRGVRL